MDDFVFLLGRPPIGEFLGFVRSMAADGPSADQGTLAQEWRTAHDHLQALEVSEAGVANGPPITPLPADLEPLAEQVRNDPMFGCAYPYVPTEFAMVDLDRLVVFQKFINLGFTEALKASLPPQPTALDAARVAFGIDRPHPLVHSMQSGGNAFTFISPSRDFRFLGAKLLPQDRVDPRASSGCPVAQVLLTVGFGSNYLNAIAVEDRLVLNNGSHRAYALREMGVRHVPCIVQRVTRREELDLVCGGELQRAPELYLEAPRPPLLKDYFDPSLRKVLEVPRKNRLVRVQFGCEQSDVPAM